MPSVQTQVLSFSDVDYYYLMWGEQNKIESFTGCLLDKAQEWHLVPFLIFHFSWWSHRIWGIIGCTYLPKEWKMCDNFTRIFISLYFKKVPILKDSFIKTKQYPALILSLGIALPPVCLPSLLFVLKLSIQSVFCIWKCTFSVVVWGKNKFQWIISVPFGVWSTK